MKKKFKCSKYIAEKLVHGRKGSKWYTMQTFRASGAGGQARNKRDTAVRLIDKQTGIFAEATDATGQLDNKESAKEKLINKLIEHYRREEYDLVVSGEHESQAWIRTYKEKNDLVIDKRLPGRQFSFDRTLNGDLDNLIQELRIADVKNN